VTNVHLSIHLFLPHKLQCMQHDPSTYEMTTSTNARANKASTPSRNRNRSSDERKIQSKRDERWTPSRDKRRTLCRKQKRRRAMNAVPTERRAITPSQPKDERWTPSQSKDERWTPSIQWSHCTIHNNQPKAEVPNRSDCIWLCRAKHGKCAALSIPTGRFHTPQ